MKCKIGVCVVFMFFYLSKIIWSFASVGMVCVFILALALLCLAFDRNGLAAACVAFCCALLFIVSATSLPMRMAGYMENYYPQQKHDDFQNITGIIVLGGGFNSGLSMEKDELNVNHNIERIFAFIDVAKQFPDAKKIFTGGNGKISHQEGATEARFAKEFIERYSDLDTSTIVFEDSSRNTIENAKNSYNLIQPKENERWVLITSAYHMPRAMNCFLSQGWTNLVPYPVDYRSSGGSSFIFKLPDFTFGSVVFDVAYKEWIGLWAYYLTGKTKTLLPPR